MITHPIAAKMWHPTKNADYDIEDITFGSEKMVWWFYPYDEPKTGENTLILNGNNKFVLL